MATFNCITTCRICDSTKLNDIIDLKNQYITSRFPVYNDWSFPNVSMSVCRCTACGLVQLKQTTFSSELYEYEYGYRSGISNTMRDHLKQYYEEICSKVELLENDVVVDIGSNDSTMLRYYNKNLQKIGVDPTGKQFQEFYGDVALIPTYFTHENFRAVYNDTVRPKLVSSISMFYDLPDPVTFAKDIHNVLHDDGIWTCEQSYLCEMIKTNSIDTICHEHLEYYALHQIKEIADRADFKIIDVKFNSCNGGSFRIYFAKRASTKYEEAIELVDSILKNEIELGIFTDEYYTGFINSCAKEVSKLKHFVNSVNQNGSEMWIYGASTKGNCLLQYANLLEKDLRYAVERNPKKIGKMTCSGSEIISEEKMRESPPDFLLVLPWHFRDEIVKREQSYLDAGGQLVFPFPQFEIVSNKPKVLITGSNGMIAKYVRDAFNNEYTLYGIVRETPVLNINNTITTFNFDMNDALMLEKTIVALNPYAIIHLASISSSKTAYEEPLETLRSNGFQTVQLCDIIHKNKLHTKLFNASSSEIYKGHVDYEVTEDDPFMQHIHPYSIAKILGHTTVQYYRQTYGLPFSNGVLFTIESPLKRREFLLNKIKDHSEKWFETKEPLHIGSLESFRNILHASDAANAIKVILDQDLGADYLICNNESMYVYDMVKHIYARTGILIENRDSVLVDIVTQLPVAYIEMISKGYDTQPTNIRGQPKKLLDLGWNPTYTIGDILDL